MKKTRRGALLVAITVTPRITKNAMVLIKTISKISNVI